ncbi:hypothetical protein ACO0K2_19490 [Undibacterium sp. MH2W]|uniref:hypothetical protein n=1 Tax=Undibacterium sp. MH2W TaxID=3413044 RepID=UPI003BF3653B
MKLAKILSIGLLACTASAHAETLTMDSAIIQAAGGLQEQFESLYGGKIEEVRLLLSTSNFEDWRYVDKKTNQGFIVGSNDDDKLHEHIKHLKGANAVKDTFATFNANVVKAIRGTDADRSDLIIRLVALQMLAEVSKPENNWNEYQQINISKSQFEHYSHLTRNIQFANQLSAEIAPKLKSSYKDQNEFMKDFVAAFVEIPKPNILKIAAGANKATAAQFKDGLTVKVSAANSEAWQAGNLQYQVKEDGSATLLNKAGTIYGAGYIDGKKYTLRVENFIASK